jgi:hypothetical protein
VAHDKLGNYYPKSGFSEAFRLKGFQVFKFAKERSQNTLHCCIQWELISGSMDRVNLESSDLKGHFLIECCFLVICIRVRWLVVHSHLGGCMLEIQTFVTGPPTRSYKSKIC